MRAHKTFAGEGGRAGGGGWPGGRPAGVGDGVLGSLRKRKEGLLVSRSRGERDVQGRAGAAWFLVYGMGGRESV